MNIYCIASPFRHAWALHPLVEWQRRGHRITVLCPDGSAMAEGVRQAGLSFVPVDMPRRMSDVGGIVRTIRTLRRHLANARPDVVYHYMLPVSCWARLASRLAGVPVRAYKPPSLWELNRGAYVAMEWATARFDTAILASSQAIETAYQRFPGTKGKILLSYYGFPLEPFDPSTDGAAVRRDVGIPSDALVIGMVGYLIPPVRFVHPTIGIKGHEVFIEAAAAVAQARPGVHFMIVGDEHQVEGRGVYAASLRRRAAEAGLSACIHFTGHRTDIPAVLAAIDVVAVPSLSENVGGAVEPLLMEKPVVASRVGGLPDAVVDGRTGFLVPPADSHALADALLKAIDLPMSRRRDMGREGRTWVEANFDVCRVADAEIALFEAQLAARQERP